MCKRQKFDSLIMCGSFSRTEACSNCFAWNLSINCFFVANCSQALPSIRVKVLNLLLKSNNVLFLYAKALDSIVLFLVQQVDKILFGNLPYIESKCWVFPFIYNSWGESKSLIKQRIAKLMVFIIEMVYYIRNKLQLPNTKVKFSNLFLFIIMC